MRNRICTSLILLGLFFMVTAAAFAQESQYLVSRQYGITPDAAMSYHNQLGSWWAVDQTLYISDRTGVSPETIIALHQNGESFPAIASAYGMTPGTYYTPAGASFSIGFTTGNFYGTHWNRGPYGTFRGTIAHRTVTRDMILRRG